MIPARSGFRFGPISPTAGPLYDQIVGAVKRELAAGRLGPGEALPSVRVLAAELLVSVITVKRAYEELERDGIIYRRQGLGAFLAEAGAERLRQEHGRQARDGIKAAVAAGRQAGLDDQALREMFEDELARKP